MNEQLRTDLKAYTVRELKREVVDVKKHFQVSKLRRRQVEDVILENQENFRHILREGARLREEAKQPKKVKQPEDTKRDAKQLKKVKQPEDTKRDAKQSKKVKQPEDTKRDAKQQKKVIQPEDTKRDARIKIRIKKILDDLDEKAKGNTKRQVEWYFDRSSEISIRKQQNHYILHDDNDNGKVILSTPNRNEAEETIYLYTLANS